MYIYTADADVLVCWFFSWRNPVWQKPKRSIFHGQRSPWNRLAAEHAAQVINKYAGLSEKDLSLNTTLTLDLKRLAVGAETDAHTHTHPPSKSRRRL